MKPNPFLGLLHSRKFWLAMLDLLIGMVTYFVARYAPQAGDDVKFVFASIQPVLLLVIGAIAYEDKAAIQADARIEEAKVYDAQEQALDADEQAALLTEAYEQGATSQ